MTPSQANQALSLLRWNPTDPSFRAALSEGEVKAFIGSKAISATSEPVAAIERAFVLAGVQFPHRPRERAKLKDGGPAFDFRSGERASGPVVILRSGKHATVYSREDALKVAESEEASGEALVARALRWCVAKSGRL
jgi:hypothetical protein